MTFLNMSIQAGLLIMAIIIIRAVALYKLPKKIFFALWTIVLIRLLIPFSFYSDFSIFNTINIVKNYFRNNIFIFKMINTKNFILNDITQTQINFIRYSPIAIWVIGIIIAAILFTINYIKSYKILRYSLPVNDKNITDWKIVNNIPKNIDILLSERITTPLSYGIIKSHIILPKYIDLNDSKLLNHIMAHEYYHIKRKDTLWKILFTIALCLHWFNPMIWIMFILVNHDMEITCDEKVLRNYDNNDKISYAYALISIAESKNTWIPIYNAFKDNFIEERIKSIIKHKRLFAKSIIISIFIILLSTLIFLSSSTGDLKNNIIDYTTINDFITLTLLYLKQLHL